MTKQQRFIDKLQRNSVALISLAIAITSLSYNTWRNEASEHNRTQRLVSMQVLMKLAELQEVVWHNHYDGDTVDKGNPRTGWTIVITVRDIATILGEPLPATAMQLFDTWESQHTGLGSSNKAKDAIIEAIEKCRTDTLAFLQELD